MASFFLPEHITLYFDVFTLPGEQARYSCPIFHPLSSWLLSRQLPKARYACASINTRQTMTLHMPFPSIDRWNPEIHTDLFICESIRLTYNNKLLPVCEYLFRPTALEEDIYLTSPIMHTKSATAFLRFQSGFPNGDITVSPCDLGAGSWTRIYFLQSVQKLTLYCNLRIFCPSSCPATGANLLGYVCHSQIESYFLTSRMPILTNNLGRNSRI